MSRTPGFPTWRPDVALSTICRLLTVTSGRSTVTAPIVGTEGAYRRTLMPSIVVPGARTLIALGKSLARTIWPTGLFPR